MDEYVRCVNDDFCADKLGYASSCAKFLNNPQYGYLNYD